MLSDFISRKDCRKIEEFIVKKQQLNNQQELKNNREEKIVVNPNYLFQESYPWIPPFYNYEPSGFELGDRVLNIKSSDIPAIPFGLSGIITGITENFLEVCFDSEFFGGTTCKDRFTSNRGAYVKPENLLNLSK